MSDEAVISSAQLRATQKAIKDAEDGGMAEIAKKLKPAGEIIAKEIRRRAPVHGSYSALKSGARRSKKAKRDGAFTNKFHRPGTLRDATKVKVSTRLFVRVVNTALAYSPKYSKGYRYGKRLEFDPAYASKYKFFYPGYEASKDVALAQFDTVLTEVVKAYGG